ncbi:uncharacterized protein LOC109832394 isoform X1 [Asparagus officinalis]|uniref:uncharacterized protein LOC109832393 isoform X1 n=1 Tax=Asparagus officinalis TaxID=4686 RepID=UPI00098E272E|nr:uncharacterized protein LOC109832393 isoform X1 [Asparagus officinalis]XP_020255362.1 uncharacterized protein LOC109832394 isoform X1 [Asparagus officinalis]
MSGTTFVNFLLQMLQPALDSSHSYIKEAFLRVMISHIGFSISFCTLHQFPDQPKLFFWLRFCLILGDAERKKAFFNPKLYSRLFVKWFLGLVSYDPLPDAANF